MNVRMLFHVGMQVQAQAIYMLSVELVVTQQQDDILFVRKGFGCPSDRFSAEVYVAGKDNDVVTGRIREVQIPIVSKTTTVGRRHHLSFSTTNSTGASDAVVRVG